MSDFEKDLYKQMSSAERVWMYLIKYAELLEFIDLMTDQDEEGLKRVLQNLKKMNEGELVIYTSIAYNKLEG